MKKSFCLNVCLCALLLIGVVLANDKPEAKSSAAGKSDSESLITDATFNSQRKYVIVPKGLRKGAPLWTDRKYVVEKLPEELIGGTLIQTPMEDRSNKNSDLISFQVQENSAVYVAVKAGREIPKWMSSWEKTSLVAKASNSLVYYRKAVSAGGKVVLGDALGLQAMYSVVIVKNNQWDDLLEGDSLELWEPGPSKSKSTEIGDRWSLKDGVLALDRDAESGKGGQIWTKKKYYDFDLKFEFNIAHNGNSGVKYRAVDEEGRALGCEYQIIDDINYRDNKNPTHRTACLYEMVAVPADRKWNPAGEWNEARIRVLNNQFEHWLNGEKVVSIEFGSDDWKERFAKSKYKVHPDFAKNAGPIVLTDHGDSVSYRNISIRDLGDRPIEKPKAAVTKTSKGAIPEPLAYTTNCKACHLIDQALVGPSLVEMSELYPRKDQDKFIQWTINPGRKREHLPQMPSMAHVPKPQLVEIYEYIKKVTVGVSKVKTSKDDPYATAPATTKRPRVQGTFVPESGPASLILALPTEKKHNVIWDTALCRLRYISVGEPDNYPYLRSNGNALALVGDIIYREEQPVFTSEELQYKGYHLSKEGFPSFVYQVGEAEITETIKVDQGGIVRSLKAASKLPAHQLPESDSEHLKVTTAQSGESIKVTYEVK